MTLSTNAELLDDALFRVGESLDGSSDYEAAALRYLNRAYRAICNGGTAFDKNLDEKWYWLQDEGVLTLVPKETVTSVSVTNNNTSITFSSSISTDLVGYHFKVDDHADVFKISTHGGGTSATLDSVYTGPTDAAAAFKAFKIDYDLAADFREFIGPFKVYQDSRVKITGIDKEEMESKWPLNLIQGGIPKNFALTDNNSVRFSHYGGDDSNDLIRVVYPYLKIPTDLADDSNEPLIPEEWRYVLSDFVTFYLLTDKNDDRMVIVGEQARGNLQAMAAENRRILQHTSDTYGQIIPRTNRRIRSKGPIRTEGGFILG